MSTMFTVKVDAQPEVASNEAHGGGGSFAFLGDLVTSPPIQAA